MASFYGNESGSKTASGARFNQNAMTAAHRSLPFGTNSGNCHAARALSSPSTTAVRSFTAAVLVPSTGAARAIGLTGAGVARSPPRSSPKRAFHRA